MSGERLIFWLFVILAGCTAAALWIFTRTEVGHLYRRRVYFALAGDLAAPVVAWFILKAIGRRRARKAQQQVEAPPPSSP